MIPVEFETMTIDTWRMEVDSNGNGGSDINMNVPSVGVEAQNEMNMETVMESELEGNPSGRTRKRFRDNRPDANVVHGNYRKTFPFSVSKLLITPFRKHTQEAI